MARAAWILAAFLIPSTASAQRPLPNVSARHEPLRVVDAALVATPAEGSCGTSAEPLRVRDPSDALTFATHPTARLDEQELASASLRGLIELQITRAGIRLYVVGAPVQHRLSFSSAGWRPRWPFC